MEAARAKGYCRRYPEGPLDEENCLLRVYSELLARHRGHGGSKYVPVCVCV